MEGKKALASEQEEEKKERRKFAGDDKQPDVGLPVPGNVLSVKVEYKKEMLTTEKEKCGKENPDENDFSGDGVRGQVKRENEEGKTPLCNNETQTVKVDSNVDDDFGNDKGRLIKNNDSTNGKNNGKSTGNRSTHRNKIDKSKSEVENDDEPEDKVGLKEKQRNNYTVNWVLKDNVKSSKLKSSTANIPEMMAGGDTREMMSKGVDFSLGPASACLDEVDEEINQVINSSADDQMQFGFGDQINNSRCLTVNTPATERTDSHFQIRSLRTPVREKYYEHALMLMNCRCKSGSTYLTSARMSGVPRCMRTSSGRQVPVYSLPSLVASINKPPFSCNPNSYFYITQQTQQQSSLLKAWKGYHGNVYFEPMTCKQLDTATIDTCSQGRTRSADETSKSARIHLPDLEERTQSRVSFADDTKTERTTRAGSRSVRSVASRRNKPASFISQKMRQMSILDRRSVMKRSNSRLKEDMSWISGQESTGSLCIGRPQQRTTPRAYNDSNKHYKLKICRGIASRSNDPTDESPVFSLHGGRLNEAANDQTNYQSNPTLATPEDSAEFYRYSSTRTSIFDGSQGNIDQSNSIVHVVPSPNQGNSRKINVKDTSFQITLSH